jgi:hypothetical protein
MQQHAWAAGKLLHVDAFARNKRGIAYQGKSRQPEAAVDCKREPHQQLKRSLPVETISGSTSYTSLPCCVAPQCCDPVTITKDRVMVLLCPVSLLLAPRTGVVPFLTFVHCV